MNAISTQIRQVLYSQRKDNVVSGRRRLSHLSVVFRSDWDPLAFLIEQEYKEESGEAIGGAFVIVQGADSDAEAEAVTCGEYVTRTWPLLGEHFMGLLKSVVRGDPGVRCAGMYNTNLASYIPLIANGAVSDLVTLFDNTKVTAWIEVSGYLSTKVVGFVETIVEVGEVFAFIAAALRSARGEDSIACITPTITRGGKTNSSKASSEQT